MAHEIDFSLGKAAFTRVEGSEIAWHGLGQTTPVTASLDQWQQDAGLDWVANKQQVGILQDQTFLPIDNQMAIVRSDTHRVLSIKTDNRYQAHQPKEILEFFDRFIKANRLTMETAGALKGGRIIFALARMNDAFAINVGGVDKVLPYFLLGTSFDGSLATHGTPTAVRVVCANTHTQAVSEDYSKAISARQRHSAGFDPSGLQRALEASGVEFVARANLFNKMADHAMSSEEINNFFIKDILDIEPDDLSKYSNTGKPLVSTKSKALITLLQQSYMSAPGADIAKGTAWGAYNAVTHFCDHTARVRDTNLEGASAARLSSAWYGQGAKMKHQAIMRLSQMVAA